ncbi:GNAT family N-acetyltransferase [Sphingomonas alpina]|uniref:GNAT family N-acetyltransferase n=1 Tax=Sphingomonas alpina TaxID=653931 RepID=A0A7H0LFG0_9SPHN|nr:GNAT family N-acetyltransferase [Sphingomonas alpina]QNQ08413.1 GNAT family N-acetyltransferase [Sphingomonas alpina]
MSDIEYRRYKGSADEAIALLLPLCLTLFPGFDPDYLALRLPGIAEPELWLAYREGELAGFKLGYRRGPHLFYSWLGGVHPSARRLGIADALMVRQHEAAAASGYTHVETRTRAVNNAMIIVNLRHGFQVVGFEIDTNGIPIVTQRKDLRG